LLLLMAAFPAMLICFTVYFMGWRSGDLVVRALMGSTFMLVVLSWLAWRFLPMRMAEVTFDVTGITFREMQNGKTRFARQTIAWSEIYALLGTGRKSFFGVELHTNGPPPGRRIVTSISGGGFGRRVRRMKRQAIHARGRGRAHARPKGAQEGAREAEGRRRTSLAAMAEEVSPPRTQACQLTR
jgi:hypothetical protein